MFGQIRDQEKRQECPTVLTSIRSVLSDSAG